MPLPPKHEAIDWLRPNRETIDWLRLTLRRLEDLEDTQDPAQNAGDFADLKEILLHRIAALQDEEPVASHNRESTDRAA